MVGNFSPDYIGTGFYSAGYFDRWNLDTDDLSVSMAEAEKSRESLSSTSTQTHQTYNFIFRPACGILNSTKPLAPKSELNLSFDRCTADMSLIDKADNGVDLSGKVLQIKNVVLTAKYYSSPFLRNYFSTIVTKDICYNYDEMSVYLKSLPKGDTTIRLANIIGGNTPKYLFAGIIESDALSGNLKKSATRFMQHSVNEFDLTLNGYSCSGFPLINHDDSPLFAYNKFMKTTDRHFINNCGGQIKPVDFRDFNFLYSHDFTGEPVETGWIGVNLKLEDAYSSNYTLGLYIENICLKT